MFQKEYIFYGSHAGKVKALVDQNSDHKVFIRNIDVLLFAPIVGLLYGKSEKTDKSNAQTTKIFPEQMIKEDKFIKYNYQIVTLLDKKNKKVIKDRVESAFRYIGTENVSDDLTRFNGYILGGVSVLYEKVIHNSKTKSDYLNNLFDFLDDINTRYNQDIENVDLDDLVSLARETN